MKAFVLIHDGLLDKVTAFILDGNCCLQHIRIGFSFQITKNHFYLQKLKVWTEQWDEQAGKARQKELYKLWRKISKPNTRIRKRKKYRTVTRFHYSTGDVLTFKGSDGLYYCSYLLFITQHRGECVYDFIPFVYRSHEKPQLADVQSAYLVGRTFPSSLHPEGLCYGLCAEGVEHKHVYDFKVHFEKIGHFEVLEKYRGLGQQGGSRDWNTFSQWHEQIGDKISAFGMQLFKVAGIMMK